MSERLLKCRFCRGLFRRPPALELHVPAIACPAPACQARRRAREEELAQRAAHRARCVRPALEVLRPAALN